MSEMVERAVSAVQDWAGKEDNDLACWNRDAISELVRVVTGALREPTEAMIEAIDDSLGEFSYFAVTAPEAWRAGIDAALKSNVEVG